MTYDELDNKIIAVKKKGLSTILEISQIAELRSDFYKERMQSDLDFISDRFHANVEVLSRIHKVKPTVNNFKEFMGLTVDSAYTNFLFKNGTMTYLPFALYVSYFYGVPVEMLLFSDLELHEQTIKQKYPFVFQQNQR